MKLAFNNPNNNKKKFIKIRFQNKTKQVYKIYKLIALKNKIIN